MAHKWKRVPRTLATFMEADKRRCSRCRKEQMLYKEHSWGRVVARSWEPKVGRCKPTRRFPRAK